MIKFTAEEYPLIIQESRGYITVFSPDWDFRIGEKLAVGQYGQIELLILRAREQMTKKIREMVARKLPSPTPSSLKDIQDDSSLENRLKSSLKEEAILSSKDAAKILGCSHDTILRRVKDGSLKCKFTPGGYARFARTYIESLKGKRI